MTQKNMEPGICRRCGCKVQLQEMDVEAFYQGLTHAKTSKLMSEELLKEKDEFN